jgi:hypothetical protein
MIFRSVTTYEKPGSDILEIIWNIKSFNSLSDCFLYEGNPYIDSINEYISDDISYVEYVVDWHDQNFYELWLDEFKDIVVPYRQDFYQTIKGQGIEFKEFWSSLDAPVLALPDYVVPLSMDQFTTRFPDKFKKF